MAFYVTKPCELCGNIFRARSNSHKFCRDCGKTFRGKQLSGLSAARYTLVACGDIMDEGLIGRSNTTATWRQLDVAGAVYERDGVTYRYDDIARRMYECADPRTPVQTTTAAVYTTGTGYHERTANTGAITLGGFA